MTTCNLMKTLPFHSHTHTRHGFAPSFFSPFPSFPSKGGTNTIPVVGAHEARSAAQATPTSFPHSIDHFHPPPRNAPRSPLLALRLRRARGRVWRGHAYACDPPRMEGASGKRLASTPSPKTDAVRIVVEAAPSLVAFPLCASPFPLCAILMMERSPRPWPRCQGARGVSL